MTKWRSLVSLDISNDDCIHRDGLESQLDFCTVNQNTKIDLFDDDDNADADKRNVLALCSSSCVKKRFFWDVFLATSSYMSWWTLMTISQWNQSISIDIVLEIEVISILRDNWQWSIAIVLFVRAGHPWWDSEKDREINLINDKHTDRWHMLQWCFDRRHRTLFTRFFGLLFDYLTQCSTIEKRFFILQSKDGSDQFRLSLDSIRVTTHSINLWHRSIHLHFCRENNKMWAWARVEYRCNHLV